MTVRDDRGDVKQITTGFRGPLMVQSLTSAKSKFLSLSQVLQHVYRDSSNTHRQIQAARSDSIIKSKRDARQGYQERRCDYL